MAKRYAPWLIGGALLCSALPSVAGELETTGKITLSTRYFANEPQFNGQLDTLQVMGTVEPELLWQSDDGNNIVEFKPYFRADSEDSERNLIDIRELQWIHVAGDTEIRSGIRKVYWGVTEFQHLVDIINQTDLAADLDGEDKLGQPMINIAQVTDFGYIDLFLLAGFRERTLPGVEGRLRPGLPVSSAQAQYESSDEAEHLDWALRWSNSIGDWDIGWHYFTGTNRDPIYKVGGSGSYLYPYYELIDQTGADVQFISGDTLWKLETIYRSATSGDYWAAQGGFEHSLYGVTEGGADLGLLLEYGWDSRGDFASTLSQNDLFIGARLAMNDEDSTELLGGISQDLDHSASSLMVEASSRFGSNWVIGLDLRLFSTESTKDPLYSLKEDDHLQLTFERYF